jgi:flagellar operon protein
MTDERIRIGSLQIPAFRPGAVHGIPKPDAGARPNQPTFQDVLREKLIRFSHHAEIRLRQRGIAWNEDKMAKLEQAVSKAEAKGARESLILFPDVALIVNVKNRTVVTAMDGDQMKDNVFTQIDSAVIVS